MVVLESHASHSFVSAVASLEVNRFLVYKIILTNLCLNHCVTFSSQNHFRRLVCFVARAFLLLVDSRLEAFVDEHEVRSRRELIPRSK